MQRLDTLANRLTVAVALLLALAIAGVATATLGAMRATNWEAVSDARENGRGLLEASTESHRALALAADRRAVATKAEALAFALAGLVDDPEALDAAVAAVHDDPGVVLAIAHGPDGATLTDRVPTGQRVFDVPVKARGDAAALAAALDERDDVVARSVGGGSVRGSVTVYLRGDAATSDVASFNALLASADTTLADGLAHLGQYVEDDLDTGTRRAVAAGAVAGGLILALGLVVGLVLARRLGGPVQRAQAVLERLAGGDVDARVVPEGTVETRAMAAAVNHTGETVGRLSRAIGDLADAGRDGDLERRLAPDDYEGGFHDLCVRVNGLLDATLDPIAHTLEVLERVAGHDLQHLVEGDYSGDHAKLRDTVNLAIAEMRRTIDSVGETVGLVDQSSMRVGEASEQVDRTARSTTAQTSSILDATREIDDSLHHIAAASEEMAASVGTIASNTRSAVEVAESANEFVRRVMGVAGNQTTHSEEIAKVLKMIDDIAEQTGLLALNAGIQAARAGDAGRSFAVVAEEIKRLATHTSAATRQISGAIDAVAEGNSDMRREVAELETIAETILDSQQTISQAVEEQRTVSQEISRGCNLAADGTRTIIERLGEVEGGAREVADGADEARTVAVELTDLSARLRAVVDSFRVAS